MGSEANFRQAPSTLPQFLKDLATQKSSNLCLTVTESITTSAALLDIVESVGHQIIILRVQPEHISDWSIRTVSKLLKLAQEKDFLIWDRSLHGTWECGAEGKPRMSKWAQIAELDLAEAGAEENNNHLDEVRDAIRNADWSSKGEVTTEIAADRDSSADRDDVIEVEVSEEEEEEEEELEEEPETNGTHGGLDADDESALRARKASVISLTSTLTQVAVDATPPTSANKYASASKRRGIVFTVSGDATSDDLCLQLARENRDLVMGYFCESGSLSAKLKELVPPEGPLVFEASEHSLSAESKDLVADLEKAAESAATKGVDVVVVSL